MVIPMGWPQPPSYQLFLWLFLWGGPSLPITSYSYGYSYGVAPASQLPAIPVVIPMAIPMGWPQPPSYQLFLWLFLWGGPSLQVTSYSYGYSYGAAPASQLPARPVANLKAIPMGWPQPPSHQLFLWLLLWGGPSLPVTSNSYGYSYGVAPSLPVTSYSYGYSYGVAPASQGRRIGDPGQVTQDS